METRILHGTKAHLLSKFCYPKVVETSTSFDDFWNSPYSAYPWSQEDAVDFRYFNTTEQRIEPLTCDEHLGVLFGLNTVSRFGKIQVDVLQPRREWQKQSGDGGRITVTLCLDVRIGDWNCPSGI